MIWRIISGGRGGGVSGVDTSRPPFSRRVCNFVMVDFSVARDPDDMDSGQAREALQGLTNVRFDFGRELPSVASMAY